MADTVLLLTHSGDYANIDWISAGLVARGVRPLRVDTDTFPGQTQLSLRQSPNGLFISGPHGRAHSDEVRAIWCRKLWGAVLPEGVDPAYAGAIRQESMAHVMGALALLDDRRWVNHPTADQAAEVKARQLQVAQQVGLSIPATLCTNQPEEAREFYATHGGKVVTKMLTPFSISMSGGSPFVYTTRLDEAALEGLDSLQLCPMVFQAEVPKDTELRVAVVNGRCFAGGIRASALDPDGPVDWRHPSLAGKGQWERETLPPALEARLVDLITRLGLVYGAVDLIRRPDGEHVFLEVNPAGEWGMLQHHLGLPIADAFVDALLET